MQFTQGISHRPHASPGASPAMHQEGTGKHTLTMNMPTHHSGDYEPDLLSVVQVTQ